MGANVVIRIIQLFLRTHSNNGFFLKFKIAIFLQKHPWLLPLVIFITNIIIRFIRINYPSIWIDEGQTLFQIQRPISDIINDYSKKQENAPFYFILMHYWALIFENTLGTIRAFSALCTSLTAVLVYFITKRYIGLIHAIGISIIFLVVSDFMHFSHEARAYAMIGLLATSSFTLFFRLMQKPTWLLAFSLFIVNLALIFTHYLTIYLFLVQFISSLFLIKEKRFFTLYMGSQILVGGLFALWLPVLLDVMPKQGVYWLGKPYWGLFMNIFYYLIGSKARTYFVFYFLAFALLIFIAFRFKSFEYKKRVIFLSIALWALLPFILNYIIGFYIPVFTPKYTYYASFGFVILVALAVRQLPFSPYVIMALYLIACIKMGGKFNYENDKGENWKQIVPIVKARMDDETLVILQANYNYKAFGYYYDPQKFTKQYPYSYLYKDKIFCINKIKELDKLLDKNAHKKIIYCQAHWKSVDPKGEMKKYLDEHYKLVEHPKQWNKPKLFFYKQKQVQN